MGKNACFFAGILLVMIFFIGNTSAQWRWAVQAGGTPGFFGNYGISIRSTPGGDLVLTGIIGRDGAFEIPELDYSGEGITFLCCLHPDGTRKWFRLIDTASSIYRENVVTVDDGGVIYQLSQSGSRIYRYSSDGDTLRSIKIDSLLYPVVELGKECLIIGGSEYDTVKKERTIIKKIELNGNSIWNWSFENKKGLCEITAVKYLNSGDVIAAGFFINNGKAMGDSIAFGSNTYISKGGYDAFLVCLDFTGMLKWTKFLVGPGDEQIISLAVSQGNEIYASGYFEEDAEIDGHKLHSRGGKDIMLMRIGKTGSLDYIKTFGSALTDDYCRDMLVDASQRVWLTGRTGDSTIIDNCRIRTAGACDAFAVSFTSDGTPVSAATFGGSTFDEGCGITAVNSDIVVTGYFSGEAHNGTVVLTGQLSTSFDLFVASIPQSEVQPLIPNGVVNHHIAVKNIQIVGNAGLYDLLGRKVSGKRGLNGLYGKTASEGLLLLRKGNACANKRLLMK